MEKRFNENGVQIYDYYIYRVTLITDGRTYVGKRYISLWYTPAKGMGKYTPGEYYGSGDHIKNAVKKYGVENFSRGIIDEYHNITDAEIKAIESKYIKAEWAAGHGEFNHSCDSYGGDIMDGMPEDMRADITDKRLATNRANHGGILSIHTEAAYNTNRANHRGVLSIHTEEALAKSIATKTEKYGNPAGACHTEEALAKSLNTRIERYGDPMSQCRTRESIDKALQSNRDHHDGVLFIHTEECYNINKANHGGILAWNTEESLEKSINTRIEKYGTPEGILNTPEVKEKSMRTLIEKYGSISAPCNTPEAHIKSNITRSKKYIWKRPDGSILTIRKISAKRMMNNRHESWECLGLFDPENSNYDKAKEI